MPIIWFSCYVMLVRVDWHRLFDQFQWAMLPTDKLLLKILNASGANQTRVRYKEAPKDLFRKVGNIIA